MLQRYAGSDSPDARPDEDFDEITRNAPKASLSESIGSMFRSDQTPPFPQLVAQLFSQSNGSQRAGLLNMLLSTVGPMLFSQVMKQNGLSGLAGLLGGGQTQVTPQEAEQIPPDAVRDLAAQAQQQNPSIVDRISDYYAENPEVVKTLGTSALSSVLSGMANSFGR
ncbi:MAG: hypothetical protein KY468_00945 [Armatimonadetes bacterium]|nr:hypothetical protein [Armatimonadota bacterium]